MLVDGSASDITASRKCHFRSLILAQQCSQKVIGCSYLLYIIIINAKISDRASVNLHRMPVNTLNHSPDPFDGFQHHVNIIHIRKVLDQYRLICHDRCCKDT